MCLILQIIFVLAWIVSSLCIKIAWVFVNLSWNICLHATFRCCECQFVLFSPVIL